MSRIGRKIIAVPSAASVSLNGQDVSVKGPRGNLSMQVVPEITVRKSDEGIHVERNSDVKRIRALHGLTRNLIANMVIGVTTGFSRGLEIRGVGYRADVKGNKLNLTLGFSHPVAFDIPNGISIAVEKQTKLTVSGIDKQLVGAVCAKIRGFRPPDAYKGKGVRYANEHIKLKAGKAGGK